MIRHHSLQDRVRVNLAQQGFLAAFGCPGGPWTGNSIPYREDHAIDKAGLMDYLKTKWLGRGWINVSPPLRDAIVGRVWEIYENAFEHSKSSIGLFSCGQHFPNKRRLLLTVVDFGVGIPANVRAFFGNQQIRADHALAWAFQPGTTTKPNGMGRGGRTGPVATVCYPERWVVGGIQPRRPQYNADGTVQNRGPRQLFRGNHRQHRAAV